MDIRIRTKEKEVYICKAYSANITVNNIDETYVKQSEPLTSTRKVIPFTIGRDLMRIEVSSCRTESCSEKEEPFILDTSEPRKSNLYSPTHSVIFEASNEEEGSASEEREEAELITENSASQEKNAETDGDVTGKRPVGTLAGRSSVVNLNIGHLVVDNLFTWEDLEKDLGQGVANENQIQEVNGKNEENAENESICSCESTLSFEQNELQSDLLVHDFGEINIGVE